jgi:membrane protein DedA with SNARE-associated domain
VIERFSYLGILGVLVFASLGLPIPEEAPIIAAGALAHEGLVRWWLALPVCLAGVLAGDIVLYWVGRRWGDRVLSWRLVRAMLSPQREEQLKASYRRHAVKTIMAARHVVGLRAAAFLTAGIAHVPFGRFLAADSGAALVGVTTIFGLAYLFTDRVAELLADVRRAEHWLAVLALITGVVVLGVAVRRRGRRLAGD